MATPIWDREEITSTLAQYKDTAYAASLESFDKGIIEAVKKGHTPEQVARCVCSAVLQLCSLSRRESTRALRSNMAHLSQSFLAFCMNYHPVSGFSHACLPVGVC